MEIDSIQALTLAFQHLEKFSIPRVGTFTRTDIPAEIDHQQGLVNPPSAKVELTKGEADNATTTAFFQSHFGLDQGKAKDLLDQVSKAIFLQLEVSDQFPVPGVGVIKKDDKGVRSFEMGPLKVADMFGLDSVNHTIAKKYVEEKKVAAKPPVTPPPVKKEEPPKKEPVAPPPVVKSTPPVTPVVAQKEAPKTPPPKAKPPVTKQPVAAKKKKRRSPVPFILIALILLLGGGGFWFRNDIKTFLADKGIFFAAAETDSTDGEEPDTNSNVTPPDTTNGDTDETDPDRYGSVNNGGYTDPTLAKTDASMMSSYTGSGERAESGQFYLIVASYRNGGLAERELDKWGESAKIVTPPGGGRYRISVFESADKDAVIQQMVSTKGQYSGGSWIYYIGM